MNNPTGMRRIQSVADLLQNAQGYATFHGACEQVIQGAPLQIFHDEVIEPWGDEVHVKNIDDVGVTYEVDSSGFCIEALDELGVGGQVFMEDFNSDFATDERMLSEIDRAHTAFADKPHGAEASEGLADDGGGFVEDGLVGGGVCFFGKRGARLMGGVDVVADRA